MLINLLSNALKFTPDRGRIEVAARADADGGLVLSVADTGVGIAPEDREAVLEPFRQGRSAAAAAEGGTGLGLSLVKSLIELHGGTIALDSRPGGGTVVSLRFPSDRVSRLAAAE
jgi:signal transduction histidine kinase